MGVWCLVFGVWCLVLGFGCLVLCVGCWVISNFLRGWMFGVVCCVLVLDFVQLPQKVGCWC